MAEVLGERRKWLRPRFLTPLLRLTRPRYPPPSAPHYIRHRYRRHRPVSPVTFIRPRLPYFPYIDREDEQLRVATVSL